MHTCYNVLHILWGKKVQKNVEENKRQHAPSQNCKLPEAGRHSGTLPCLLFAHSSYFLFKFFQLFPCFLFSFVIFFVRHTRQGEPHMQQCKSISAKTIQKKRKKNKLKRQKYKAPKKRKELQQHHLLYNHGNKALRKPSASCITFLVHLSISKSSLPLCYTSFTSQHSLLTSKMMRNFLNTIQSNY